MISTPAVGTVHPFTLKRPYKYVKESNHSYQASSLEGREMSFKQPCTQGLRFHWSARHSEALSIELSVEVTLAKRLNENLLLPRNRSTLTQINSFNSHQIELSHCLCSNSSFTAAAFPRPAARKRRLIRQFIYFPMYLSIPNNSLCFIPQFCTCSPLLSNALGNMQTSWERLCKISGANSELWRTGK